MPSSCKITFPLRAFRHVVSPPFPVAATRRKFHKKSTQFQKSTAHKSAVSSTPLSSDPSASRLEDMLERQPMTETYVSFGITDTFVKDCMLQADYRIPQREPSRSGKVPMLQTGEELGVQSGEGKWISTLDLYPTFSVWSHVSFIHLYLLNGRFRMFATPKIWQQHMTDHFFYRAEERMATLHALSSRSMRNKYLKNFFGQWCGLLVAYDEGIIKGDAILATAIWRNLFKAADVDGEKLASVVSYMRRWARTLAQMSIGDFLAGRWKFGGIENELKHVRVESDRMKVNFADKSGS